ncbi:MAG TPA: hypothetical protein PK688_03720 [Tenuifilaceae bacterium]|nr:hypothetical protein [Tenuifilaceae bacterium]
MQKKFLKIFLLACLPIFALALVYFILKLVAVNGAVDRFQKFYSQLDGDDKSNAVFQLTNDSAYNAEQNSYAYYHAQLEAANSDSVVLCINFPDSTATLLIKGVTVHTAKIDRYRVSNFFTKIDQRILYKALSYPFRVERQTSSIPKVPLMIKIAPKDTSEYTPDIVPDTTDVNPVYFLLETKPGMLVYFYETPKNQSRISFNGVITDIKDRTAILLDDLQRIVHFRKLDYKPSITLRLNRKDAKIIFRAIPNDALIILKLS